MDFTELAVFIEETKAKDLDIFGYSLCWHEEQNGTFLNGRYGPKEFETPSFPNLLDKTGLEDGSFNGWEINTGNGGSIESSVYNGDPVVKLTTGASSINPDDVRLTSSMISVTETTYEGTLFILSDVGGTGRITFEGLTNNTPKLDWTGNGAKTETFVLDPGWNKISFQVEDFAEANFKFYLDLGYTANVTYYVHILGLSVVDINSEFFNPDEFFLEAEAGVVGSMWTIENDEDASGGQYVVVPDNNNSSLLTPGDVADNNIVHTFDVITPGEYKFWVRVLHPTASDDSYHFKVDENDWYTFNNQGSASYGWFIIDTFDLAIGEHTVTTSWREDGAQLDKLYFTLTDATPTGFGSPSAKTSKILLDLETAEKVSGVTSVLQNWIESVISYAKEDVNVWTVVSEPMDDMNPSELKTGNNIDLENEFYWQDYLGKDYAVIAFNTARANAKQGDLLFISDYGLEGNIDKCQGLIDYVNYIESQGASVDGIAVQMHLTLESDPDDISAMFQLLAQTGKLVKVAQLEVRVSGDVVVTEDILLQQAEIYKSAVNSFFQDIPAGQQYGIEISGLVDTDNNSNGLWDASYNRKPAYAGFADALIENQ